MRRLPFVIASVAVAMAVAACTSRNSAWPTAELPKTAWASWASTVG